MDDQNKFIEIFSGLDRAYGQTQSREKNEAGKLEGRSWLVKEPITRDKWINHLEGKEPSHLVSYQLMITTNVSGELLT
jgi:hypothetical protein